jgi:hypothetical protein
LLRTLTSNTSSQSAERIENLPAGTHVFIDANIFIYAFLGYSNRCRDLLGRCVTEEVLGITRLDVINEVTHRMMVAEAVGTGGPRELVDSTN